VADNASEYCRINCVPAELTAAALNVGEDVSAPKLNPPTTSTGVDRSVVVPSPSRPLFAPQHFTPPDEVPAQV
jgi:hypothetical protein